MILLILILQRLLRAIPSGIYLALISPKRWNGWSIRAFGEVHRLFLVQKKKSGDTSGNKNLLFRQFPSSLTRGTLSNHLCGWRLQSHPIDWLSVKYHLITLKWSSVYLPKLQAVVIPDKLCIPVGGRDQHGKHMLFRIGGLKGVGYN